MAAIARKRTAAIATMHLVTAEAMVKTMATARLRRCGYRHRQNQDGTSRGDNTRGT